ncbi:MAG: STAS domain-containing protein [Lentisphaeria bacterium]|nr:STAS domain-containing protein [Lentisphaeria bacterium]
MRSSDLLISDKDGVYTVKVSGRANFEYAVPLREIAKGSGVFRSLVIDLGPCTAMDSTFMGVLTMLALKTRRDNTRMTLYNANPALQKLLRDLGVIKLFTFAEGKVELPETSAAEAEGPGLLDTAETLSEAHHTLIDAEPANMEKFRDVVAFADADVRRLKGNGREGASSPENAE